MTRNNCYNRRNLKRIKKISPVRRAKNSYDHETNDIRTSREVQSILIAQGRGESENTPDELIGWVEIASPLVDVFL